MSFFDVSRPQIADYGQATQQGMQTGQQMAQLKMLAKYGPGIMQGDKQALSALSMFDPEGAFRIRDTITQRGIQASDRAAATAKEERAAFENTMRYAAQAQSPEEFDRIVTAVSRMYPQAADMVGQFEQLQPVARLFAERPEVIDEMELLVSQLPPDQQEAARVAFIQNKLGLTPKSGDSEFERHLMQFPPEEQERLRVARAEEMAGLRGGQQTRITTDANGNPVIEMGRLGDAGATARDKDLGKAEAADVTAIRDAADLAAERMGSLKMAEWAASQLPMTGIPWSSEIHNAVQRALTPTQQQAIAILRTQTVEQALSLVQQTKGAISNAEMGLFQQTAAGLEGTPEGNQLLLQGQQAVAARAIARADFIESLTARGMSLAEAQAKWRRYASDEKNHVIRIGENGIEVTPADPSVMLRDALSQTTGLREQGPPMPPEGYTPPAQPGNPRGNVETVPIADRAAALYAEIYGSRDLSKATPAEIAQMTPSDLSALASGQTTPEQRQAISLRIKELRRQGVSDFSSNPAP